MTTEPSPSIPTQEWGELERAAREATGGVWFCAGVERPVRIGDAYSDTGWSTEHVGYEILGLDDVVVHSASSGFEREEDATFAARANPATILRLLAERSALEERVRVANISLDTLPFWPWLRADPFQDDPNEQLEATERRVRANYETAREPIPNQYALLHRADIQRLIHSLWRRRALQGLIDTWKAEKEAAETALKDLKAEVVRVVEPFEESWTRCQAKTPTHIPRLADLARGVCSTDFRALAQLSSLSRSPETEEGEG